MITKDYVVLASQGLHARPATTLIKLAKNYKSAISLTKGEKTIKLNSMLNILSLAIKGGETIKVSVDGDDEVSALMAIDRFFTLQLKHL